MRRVGLLLLSIALVGGCGSSPEASPAGTASNAPDLIATTASTALEQSNSTPSSSASGTDFVPSGPGAASAIPSPNLGEFTDQVALIAALVASGPLDDQMHLDVSGGLRPSRSICADIADNDASAGTVVHQAIATLNGQTGVVLVFEHPDGGREVRMYGTGDADPVTGGCPLWFQAAL